MDRLVTFSPHNLTFQIRLNKQTSTLVNMTNISEHPVAYKVKTTNLKRYCVRPNAAVLKPSQSITIQIDQQAFKSIPPDLNSCPDRFLLMVASLKTLPQPSNPATDDNSVHGLASITELWKSIPSDFVLKKKMVVNLQMLDSYPQKQIDTPQELLQPTPTQPPAASQPEQQPLNIHPPTQPITKEPSPPPKAQPPPPPPAPIRHAPAPPPPPPLPAKPQAPKPPPSPEAPPPPPLPIRQLPAPPQPSAPPIRQLPPPPKPPAPPTRQTTPAQPSKPTPLPPAQSPAKKPPKPTTTPPPTSNQQQPPAPPSEAPSSQPTPTDTYSERERVTLMRIAPKIKLQKLQKSARQRIAIERAAQLSAIITQRQSDIDAMKLELREARHRLSDARMATTPAYDVKYETNDNASLPFAQIFIMAVISSALLQLLV
ncbi:Vesicle-associated protein 2-2 [Gracilariopsis chorda]|uniref:Vesicle-associated protein 2-2 n=1 Tax=Gracilariopsis chorda TaxID=448386 RepID=A0A2V3IV75_9FLOR|nr:Vesicle-associated protein 2-2 [Gracilariopsis chorda]|eukprot:PXF45607.1 Vesicle-associated protein 2-2 [Gracilariopsis chorda]